MRKFLMVIISIGMISGCTSQRLYGGAIYIVNSCEKTIHVVADSYTSRISPVGGGDVTQFELATSNREIIAVFILAKSDQNIAHIFSEEGADFRVIISDGKKEKVFHGQEVYRLSENVTSSRDRKHDDVNYEIRSKEICP
ncbi:hypothetical protein [Lelliottia wanjuensis]|uniref:Lipoprotein n=1 Tax=Lelliottia wanjuensis TaxID=3050585 RepID=A0AAP4FV74_9ENTR|nr:MULTISPECIES: hypothetical protein [unclassified Lelliottia]MDK9364655.1 hypothetical protein [Lelliottia sp. V106_12]MDK9583869.1 hypothetical protein [Lelliottia sp. V86_10]MDK9617551.1 hypothetical protein [Lelliottia sp. V106_9]